jgi:hypothetical protein
VGLEIRYMAPPADGVTFAYSVQRRADGAYFDFEQGIYRPLASIPRHAATAPLVRGGEAVVGHFGHLKLGEEYIVHLIENRPTGMVTYKWPITADADSCGSGGGVKHMEPSYSKGKKFLDGKAIEAKFRYTFHGDDGFTVHTATLWKDGTSSCNCPRWGPHKRGQERRCIHSDRALTLTANVDETGAQPDPPAAVPSQATSPFRRRSRTVDT